MLCQWETETANKLILLTRLRLLTERTVGVKKCFYKYWRITEQLLDFNSFWLCSLGSSCIVLLLIWQNNINCRLLCRTVFLLMFYFADNKDAGFIAFVHIGKNVHWFFKLRHQNCTMHAKLESQWSWPLFCGAPELLKTGDPAWTDFWKPAAVFAEERPRYDC